MRNLFTILLLALAITLVLSEHHHSNTHEHIDNLKKKFNDALINLKESADNLKEGLKGGYEQARDTVKGDTSAYEQSLLENINLIGEKIKEGLKGMKWSSHEGKEESGSEETQDNQATQPEKQEEGNHEGLEYIKGPSFVGQVKENLQKAGEKIKSAVGLDSNKDRLEPEEQEEL